MRDPSGDLFLKITLYRMIDHYLPKLIKCLRVISYEQLWSNEYGKNSIGGIILHLCEHMSRHNQRHLKREYDHKTGIESYFPDGEMSPSELMKYIQDQFRTWENEMEKLIKANDREIDMHSFYHLVEHSGYHLGQIIDRVQRVTGITFDFVKNGINEKNLREKIEKHI